MNNKYAPVIIPTLNRCDHLKRCLESLEQCTLADRTDVYVALDFPPSEKYIEGWKKNDEYLREKERSHSFKSLNVIRRKYNYYFSNNSVYSGVKELATKDIGYYITSEDDNEFSPCFLDFMNKALQRYDNNINVSSVCGYVPLEWECMSNSGVLFTRNNAAYGLGIWVEKPYPLGKEYCTKLWEKKYWKIFFTSPPLAIMFMSMIKRNKLWGDVKNSCYNIVENKYQVRPYRTLVRQYGQDGTGVNSLDDCGKEQSRKLMVNSIYTIDDDLVETKLPWSTYYKVKNAPIKIFKYFVLSILVRYFGYTLE